MSSSSLIKNQPAAWGKKNSVEPSRTRNLCNQSSTSESSTGNSPGKGVHRCQVETVISFNFLEAHIYIYVCVHESTRARYLQMYIKYAYMQIYTGMFDMHGHTYCTPVYTCILDTHTHTHIYIYIHKCKYMHVCWICTCTYIAHLYVYV